jgi:HEAT repeat protein
MVAAREEATRLVRQVSDGEDVLAATARLSALGEAAVDEVLDMREGKRPEPPSARHPRDRLDDLSGVLQAVAAVDPAPLIAAIEARPQHVSTLVWALCASAAEEATEALVRALGHRVADVRWAAAAALRQRPSPRAQDALTARLGDRSSRVRFAALLALEQSCDARALPALRRFLERGRLSAGARRIAEAMVRRLTAEG